MGNVRNAHLENQASPEAPHLLRITIRRLAYTATNPLTETEKRRLLELIDRDDLIIEETDESLRLARRFVLRSTGTRCPMPG
jgi:hypothetical protein